MLSDMFWQKSSLQWSLQLRFLEKSPTKDALDLSSGNFGLPEMILSFFFTRYRKPSFLAASQTEAAKKKMWRLFSGCKGCRVIDVIAPPDCLIRGFKFLVIPSEVKDLRKKTAGIPADAEFLKWWFCFEFFWKSGRCVCVCSFHWRCDLSPRVLDLFQVICLLRTMVNHPFFTTFNVRILGWNTFFFKTFEVYRVYPSGVVCCFTSCDTPADWDVCCNSQVFIVVEKPRAPAETVVVSSFRGWNATATGLFQRSGWPWAVVEAQLNNTAAPWQGGVWCGKWFKDPNKFNVNLRCTIEERGRDMTTWLRVFLFEMFGFIDVCFPIFFRKIQTFFFHANFGIYV